MKPIFLLAEDFFNKYNLKDKNLQLDLLELLKNVYIHGSEDCHVTFIKQIKRLQNEQN